MVYKHSFLALKRKNNKEKLSCRCQSQRFYIWVKLQHKWQQTPWWHSGQDWEALSLLLEAFLFIKVIGSWRDMLGWASPAACWSVEWWTCWAWVMKHGLSSPVLYLDLAPLMVLIIWVLARQCYFCVASLLCDVPQGPKLPCWATLLWLHSLLQS